MEKLILIDGNSLLNRAFYAMNVFSTSEGLPTNGIFGFVKLIFKILDEQKPKYMAIAFDVHAPTFRHTMYKEYKGTRKPMPEELRAQVPVLKELLLKMNIHIVELAGYEADDLIGTLSRKFEGVHKYIYTGDRDSYQLVKEDVTVCFTKRGVSDLDMMTNENFFEKTGLHPLQIIDEKSLMGDSSDNIPGVRGIGPKTALNLLAQYQTLDNIYAHIDEIKGSTKDKLIADEESARLSYTLATIDTGVPIGTTLEDCLLTLPFGEEAREYFAKLEFRSLMDNSYFEKAKPKDYPVIYPDNLTEFAKLVKQAGEFSYFVDSERKHHFYFSEQEYILPVKYDFFSEGYFEAEIVAFIGEIFTSDVTVVLSDGKSFLHDLDALGILPSCRFEDVGLLRYLSDSNLKQVTVKELAENAMLTERNGGKVLFDVYRSLVEKLAGSKESELYREIELPLVSVLFEMEKQGIRVDENAFPEFSARFRAIIDGLSEKIFALAGCTFNLNSPSQLSDVLFGKLAIKPTGAKKNAKGGYSTNADVLEKLAEEHEIVRLILRYREVQKLQSTYIDGIRPLIRKGYVHTTYNQSQTATGRLSSTNPNLQNIPVRREEGRELRKLFLPSEGCVLVDADYSQIELRLLAHCADCKPLIDAYNRGEDIHTATASTVFGVEKEKVTSELRRRAKAVNFGVIYGISPFGLAKDLNISNGEAAGYINDYFAKYPEVRAFMDENVRFAKENGYVVTLFGRRRMIPELKSSNFNVRAFGERAAMNMPLQGSSADIIKIAMINVANRLKKEGMRTKLILQVHDELLLDSPLEEAERAATILKEEMEGAANLKVPLTVEVSTGKNWYEAK